MKYLLWILLVMAFSPAVLADILWMHNGDRLSGTIEEVTDTTLRIILPYGNPVTVQRKAVKRWRLAGQDKPIPTSKGGIRLLALSTDDDKGWLWTGSTDLNSKLKHNEKKTNNVNLKATTEIANLNWRYSLSGEYIYETANNLTNSHQYRLVPTLDFFFDDHWFLRSGLDLGYDMLEPEYLDLSYTSGLGYRFWSDRQHRLEVIAQAGLERAYFRDGYWESIAAGLFKERIIDYPLFNLGLDYRQPFSLWQEKIELFSKGDYSRFIAQPSPYVTRQQALIGSVGIRYYFNDHLRLSWSSELEWEDIWLDIAGTHIPLADKEWRHYLSVGASF
ncbi:DUF481 domain-containing protein [Aeromonas cavernicola]|uniref:DUF481 domain-containing protein n=1 Tax=Aeromonas cavernicola TaxID=1006623 RepID=A0A2H9U9D7_9GAMM|nr:DUF481 domain-containing protein [Aeromonas cavernicola]PJG60641.1 hypothetical protein CUC53_01180 [Aeromonas cavernicola]